MKRIRYRGEVRLVIMKRIVIAAAIVIATKMKSLLTQVMTRISTVREDEHYDKNYETDDQDDSEDGNESEMDMRSYSKYKSNRSDEESQYDDESTRTISMPRNQTPAQPVTVASSPWRGAALDHPQRPIRLAKQQKKVLP